MAAPNLPNRIAVVMLAAILCFLVALGGLVYTIRAGMDERAVLDSVRLVGSRIKALQVNFAATTEDYAIWGSAYGNILARDLDWIYENFAVSAINGDLFDGVVISGGAFGTAVAWVRAGPVTPGPSFLPKQVELEIAARLAVHDPMDNQTENFVILLEGQPTFVSASQVKPDDPARRAGLVAATLPVAILTRSLSQVDLDQIATELALTDIRFVAAAPDGQPGFALSGIDGLPVVYLTWQPARPGTLLMQMLLPVLLLVASAFVGVAAGAATLMARYARRLVASEQEATLQARQDSMTGLPNRLGFIEHLRRVEPAGVGQIAVLFIDIDGFKRINDTMGHDAGDTVVRDFAKRMGDLADAHTLFARIGGDEFVFVIHDPGGVATRISRLSEAFAFRLARPFAVAGHSLHLTVSQGLAIKQQQDHTTSELLRRADLAMYHAKRGGLGRLVSFSSDLEATTQTQASIARALQAALIQPQQFSMLYQPVVDPKTKAVQRVVALARWQSPTLGPIDPGVFVPVAEATGQMATLGWLLLDRVGVDLATCPTLRISFRISPRQLHLPQFVADLADRWARHGISADRVELSLPEPGISGMGDGLAQHLELFHRAGFTSSLDCFGTGFSNISDLRRLPFQTLKLDQSLIGEDPVQDHSAELIGSLVHLGHAMGKQVVCKGLNHPDQVAAVLHLGCDGIQGNAVGAPVPIGQFLEMYRSVAAPASAA